MLGTLDYLHHLAGDDNWTAAAFVRGYGGARNDGLGDGWEPELGASGGLQIKWKGLP